MRTIRGRAISEHWTRSFTSSQFYHDSSLQGYNIFVHMAVECLADAQNVKMADYLIIQRVSGNVTTHNHNVYHIHNTDNYHYYHGGAHRVVNVRVVPSVLYEYCFDYPC